MLERLNKLKSSVQYYMANFKNDQDLKITPEEWQLVTDIILLLALFFVTKECSKINTMLSSVKLHAKSLTKFVNFNENCKEVSNVCKT